ncbi:hypothetical protein D3C81_1110120 [compost metagenome]
MPLLRQHQHRLITMLLQQTHPFVALQIGRMLSQPVARLHHHEALRGQNPGMLPCRLGKNEPASGTYQLSDPAHAGGNVSGILQYACRKHDIEAVRGEALLKVVPIHVENAKSHACPAPEESFGSGNKEGGHIGERIFQLNAFKSGERMRCRRSRSGSDLQYPQRATRMLRGYAFQQCADSPVKIARHQMVDIEGTDIIKPSLREQQRDRVLLPKQQLRQLFRAAPYIVDEMFRAQLVLPCRLYLLPFLRQQCRFGLAHTAVTPFIMLGKPSGLRQTRRPAPHEPMISRDDTGLCQPRLQICRSTSSEQAQLM